jgi:hypothetical protein
MIRTLTIVLALMANMTLLFAGHADAHPPAGISIGHEHLAANASFDPAGDQTSAAPECENGLLHCTTAVMPPAVSAAIQFQFTAFQLRPTAHDLATGRSLASEPPPPRI